VSVVKLEKGFFPFVFDHASSLMAFFLQIMQRIYKNVVILLPIFMNTPKNDIETHLYIYYDSTIKTAYRRHHLPDRHDGYGKRQSA
jgi:hypothetical protein